MATIAIVYMLTLFMSSVGMVVLGGMSVATDWENVTFRRGFYVCSLYSLIGLMAAVLMCTASAIVEVNS